MASTNACFFFSLGPPKAGNQEQWHQDMHCCSRATGDEDCEGARPRLEARQRPVPQGCAVRETRRVAPSVGPQPAPARLILIAVACTVAAGSENRHVGARRSHLARASGCVPAFVSPCVGARPRAHAVGGGSCAQQRRWATAAAARGRGGGALSLAAQFQTGQEQAKWRPPPLNDAMLSTESDVDDLTPSEDEEEDEEEADEPADVSDGTSGGGARARTGAQARDSTQKVVVGAGAMRGEQEAYSMRDVQSMKVYIYVCICI